MKVYFIYHFGPAPVKGEIVRIYTIGIHSRKGAKGAKKFTLNS